ncbi:MAG: carbamoyltransferase HypF [Solirubrobacteraceae bacterium]
MTASAQLVRARARVHGTVQGVGFRPFVYRLAHEEAVAGFVRNDEHGVVLEVEGDTAAVERFLTRLRDDAPPRAAVEAISREAVPPRGERGFQILASASAGQPDALIAADSATCPDCLAELTDPSNRRYRYPFTNCTNCGPRFTIVSGVPYDRPLTTMAGFAMCEACRREYEDPLDRRFHAQPNACPRCGPAVRALSGDGTPVGNDEQLDAIGWAARELAEGAVLAVKGLGGYHLVCAAADEIAVAALRARKHREDKPFALMVASLGAARGLVTLTPSAEALLESTARPIVLAPRRFAAPVAAAVAPEAPELGVMLPYTPLHHLLLTDFEAHGLGGALVMTSGNVSDEPIAYRDDDALARLSGIADGFLIHDRPIQTRTDDSVTRTVLVGTAGSRPLWLRRSRGYVPAALGLPIATARPLLAAGAEQKNTFTVAKAGRAWVSHHIGDLEHLATLEAYREGIAHFERLFAVEPELVAHDLHPGYLSTAYALERAGVPTLGVQHHHAHLSACLAEHGVTEPAVAAIYDGTGYGLDGTIWGGELLTGDLTDFGRAGWLWPVRMPGGVQAIRQPWRMACAWLSEAADASQGPPSLPSRLAGRVEPARWAAISRIGAQASVSPLTSSMGRLFDAVGALCGLALEVTYEGQAAVALEAAAWRAAPADRHTAGDYALQWRHDGRLDPRAALVALAGDLERGVRAETVAARFHAAVAAATVDAVQTIAGDRGLGTAVLSGGVFQNRLLLETVATRLEHTGLRVLIPERLPPNDGGISYGQAAVAAALNAG